MLAKQSLLVGFGIVVGISIGVGIPRAQAQVEEQKTRSINTFPDLVGGLKATPGCLDARQGSLEGGKQLAIFAWFKNKSALKAWYKGNMHSGVMKKYFPNMPAKPSAIPAFKDEKSPLLVVATITPGKDAGVPGTNLAISQIAIEIYTPVPGGLAFGGGFGPKSMVVPGMVRVD